MPDMTLAAFIAHIASFPERLEHETHKGLERAAVIVEAEAKKEIGTYQEQAGPFAAWPELADSTKEDRSNRGFAENDPLLRTGALRDSIEHVVEGHEAVVGSNSDVALWQELGTDKIPARSFLGGAAFRKGEAVANILGRAATSALIGRDVFEGKMNIPSGE